jgi:hypothetical protein
LPFVPKPFGIRRGSFENRDDFLHKHGLNLFKPGRLGELPPKRGQDFMGCPVPNIGTQERLLKLLLPA